jgi:hypothetical protein
VIEAVETTTKFLRNFPDVVDGGLHIPLGKLEDALLSLDDGLVPPLLRPVKRGGRVRAPAMRECEKGTAAFTVARLIATGVPKSNALEKVCPGLS